jgi:hypothetical protein
VARASHGGPGSPSLSANGEDSTRIGASARNSVEEGMDLVKVAWI